MSESKTPKHPVTRLYSRYRDVNTIVHYVDETTRFITSDGGFVRIIKAEGDPFDLRAAIKAIDFEGGPMIGVGDTLEGRKIKCIYSAYIIEYEE